MLYWVVPITSTSKPFPTRIALDSRTVTTGYTLVDQLRSMDLAKKHPEKKEVCPTDILQEVMDTIRSIVEVR